MTQLNQPVSTYTPQLLSHQTGLSVTATTANTGYDIGSAISIPRNGIAKITVAGHVSAGTGFIYINLTRGSTTYALGSISASLLVDKGEINVISTSSIMLSNIQLITSGAPTYALQSNSYSLELPVLSGDSLQFLAGNGTAGDITYIDDMVVVLQ